MKQPTMKPNKPWKDRKKQIAEGKRTDAETETDNEKEIARWERKKEEIKWAANTKFEQPRKEILATQPIITSILFGNI